MKKIISVLVLMVAIVNTSPLFAARRISEDAWTQIRELQAVCLECSPNKTKPDTTIAWIANYMNKWLRDEKKKYETKIQELQNQIWQLKNDTNRNSTSSSPSVKDDSTRAEQEKIQFVENELKYYKKFSQITSTMLGIILAMFIAFILIKKCQAKKFPKVIEEAIEEAIASQDK